MADNDLFAKTQINQEFGDSEDSDDMDQLSDDGADDNTDKNQYFNVDDAEPPTNYDDPYSTLPQKVESRLDNIKVTVFKEIYLFFREMQCQVFRF